MPLGLYIEAVRKHEERHPGYLVELDEKLGGALKKCPECDSPMICFATRWRQSCAEFICPKHGLVVLGLGAREVL